jgi:hypothetical protein
MASCRNQFGTVLECVRRSDDLVRLGFLLSLLCTLLGSNRSPAWLYFLLGLLLRWAALRLPGNPIISFCLLGGLESVPEHAIAIYRFHILQIPFLQDTTAAAIFILAYFEYVVYWSLALCLAIAVDRLLSHIRKRTAQ